MHENRGGAMDPLFNQDNVKALLDRLVPGSLAHDLVTAASLAAAQDGAATELAATLDQRVDDAREALSRDAGTP